MKKFCSLLIAVLMVFSMMPTNLVFAAQAKDSTAKTSSSNDNTSNKTSEVTTDGDDFSDKGRGNLKLSESELKKIPEISSTNMYNKIAKNSVNSKAKATSDDSAKVTSVDNSKNEYFPEIGDQGSVGSCCAWADIYYQMSYMENRALDRPSTRDNSCSPLWVYNIASRGIDNGMNASDTNLLASKIGVASLRTSPNTSDYKSYTNSEDAWTEAQKYRISGAYRISLGSGTTPITSPDDSDLDTIKSALASGEILTFSTYINGWKYNEIQQNAEVPENSKHEGETIAAYSREISGNHRMTIVGYNDNIWTDINGNGKVEEGEKGAFKIANSWGKSFCDDGFVWLSYDTINAISSVNTDTLSTLRNNCSMISEVMGIEVAPVEDASNINLVFNVSAKLRKTVRAEITATKGTDSNTENIDPLSSLYSTYADFSFNGTSNESSCSFAFDLSKVISTISSDNLKDYKWTVKFTDIDDDDSILKINSVKIVDNNYDTVYNSDISSTVSLNNSSKEINVNTSATPDTGNDSVTIYYKSGFTTPYIHFKTDGGNWTTAPGYAMNDTNEISGYGHKYTISLNGAAGAQVCFNDGNNNWDSNNTQNYYFKSGTYKYYNGTYEKVTIDSNALKVKNFSEDSVDNVLYTNQSLTLTANAMNGTAPYQYQFGYIKNGNKTTCSFSAQNSHSFNFTDACTITPFVNVKDSSGNTTTKTLSDISVKKSINISNFRASVTEPQKVNSKINLLGEVENAVTYNGYLSLVYIEIWLDNRLVSKVSCYGSNSIDYLWVPEQSGNYKIDATVFDDMGHSAHDSMNYSISNTDGSTNATIYYSGLNNPYLNTVIDGKLNTVKMSSDNSLKGYNYSGTFDMSSNSKAQIYFTDADGNKDDNNGNNYSVSYGSYIIKNGTLKHIFVNSEPLKCSSVDYSLTKNSTISAGGYAYMQYDACGGVGPYKVNVGFVKDGTPVVVSTFGRNDLSQSNITSYFLYHGGKYNGYVKITDALGNSVEKTSDDVVTVNGLSINNFTTSLTSPQKVSTTIMLKAELQNCFSGELKFEISKDNTVVDTITADTYGNAKWIPKSAGNYTITAKASDIQGQTASQSMEYKILNGPLEIIDITSDITSDKMAIGQTYYITVNAGGGNAPYKYQFGYKNGDITKLFDYSTNNQYSNTFSSGGNYTIFVNVKDAKGNVVHKDIASVQVDGLVINSINTDVASPVQAGTCVHISADFSNARSMYGSYGTCTYTIKKDSKTIAEYSGTRTTSIDWTPTEAGTYEITYNMSDLYGQTATKSINYVVNKKTTTNNVTVYYAGYDNPNIHYQIGNGAWTTVPGVAMAKTTEQTGYTHKYNIDLGTQTALTFCFNDGNNNWDSKNGANYSLTNISGSVRCGVKNGNKETLSSSPLSNLSIGSFTSSVTSSSCSKGFTVTAQATGGSGTYSYQYGYKFNGICYYLNDCYSDNYTTYNYTLNCAGTYDLFVNVKDSNGNTATKTIDNFSVIDNSDPISISNFSASKPYINLGESIFLYSVASNGTQPYSFYYYYEIDGVKHKIENSDNSSYCPWTPDKAGTYSLFVEVVDVNGKKAECSAAETFTVTLCGDTNLDGIFSISDASALQNYLAGSLTLGDISKHSADVNNDGKVNVLDVTYMQMLIAGIIKQ